MLASCNPHDLSFAGARIAIYPMHDRFAETILNAVRRTNPAGLFIATDDLGTTVQGDPRRVFAYAEELFVRACAGAEHVTAVMHFSAGGERVSDRSAEAIPPEPLPQADFPVAAGWAIYPLGVGAYAELIERAVQEAVSKTGVESKTMSYASRLDGSAATIFRTFFLAFTALRAEVPHTVLHTVLSKGSPSVPGERIDVYEL